MEQSYLLEEKSGDDTLIGGDGFNFLDGGTDNDLLQGCDSQDDLVGGFEADTLEGDDSADILIGGNIGADDNEQDKLTGGKGLDIFILQTVVGADQSDTITDVEDGTDLFGGITFDAVTRIEQNGDDADIMSSENIVARVLNTTAVDITVAGFVQPIF